MEHGLERLRQAELTLRTFAKWILLSCLVGALVGGAGVLFAQALRLAVELRSSHDWIPYLMPLGGVVIVWLYRAARYQDQGTNLVLSTIRAQSDLPLRVAPLIFVSTVITQGVGGSAGKEGAALQLGGSLGGWIGRWMKLDARDNRVAVMCGMSAAFSVLFGTPMAAAIFPMEVASVGIFYYAALVPCVLSSYLASFLAETLGVGGESFLIAEPLETQLPNAGWVILLAVLCAGVSILFCVALEKVGAAAQKYLKNPYLRVMLASLLVLALSRAGGTGAFLGAGMPMIQQALAGHALWYAFLLKMLLTAITLKGGFKGGEIVPSFVVGATFGCLVGNVLGISPSACAALGMVAVFCGVTNCPITSTLIGFELFGYACAPPDAAGGGSELSAQRVFRSVRGRPDHCVFQV